MHFVVPWLWYLLAFLAGSAVAWLLTIVAIRPTSRQAVLDALPGWRETGDR